MFLGRVRSRRAPAPTRLDKGFHEDSPRPAFSSALLFGGDRYRLLCRCAEWSTRTRQTLNFQIAQLPVGSNPAQKTRPRQHEKLGPATRTEDEAIAVGDNINACTGARRPLVVTQLQDDYCAAFTAIDWICQPCRPPTVPELAFRKNL